MSGFLGGNKLICKRENGGMDGLQWGGSPDKCWRGKFWIVEKALREL